MKVSFHLKKHLLAETDTRRRCQSARAALLDASLVTQPRLSPQEKGGIRKYFRLSKRGEIIVDAILYSKKISDKVKYTTRELEILSTHSSLMQDSVMQLLKLSSDEYNIRRAEMYLPNLISHLKTGYSEIYDILETTKELDNKRVEARSDLKSRIKDRLKKDIKEITDNQMKNIYEVIDEKMRLRLKDYPSHIEEKIQKCDNGIFYKERRLLNNVKPVQEVKGFITNISNDYFDEYRLLEELEME